MSTSLAAITREDPVALVESCHSALTWILRRHQGKPIPRFWIDHPYGEEEITLLEEELLPAMEQFLARLKEIDEILLAQQELMERCQAEAIRDGALAAEPLAAA
ncbi:hypothetical protein KBZ18_11010 [Synechococcus sp. Cruz-9H2]|uniref:hypothetical protein n=1 Tax=unclassified Synechococcus TaxID=2626047 RepID=UPI0020CF8D9D|nr:MULTISPECIES: hypothetical protein [unclassified Synechococcus]MCP9820018.1 hypothetical protein [Synechococcus sp. Cruz-9H2]MCP9844324.1 hypothetical protein [Synechococcus sp. Edmonson 11F2]MCP9856448.1 hypothetical protein [Synechococcus sp. Cruz-9C9]MCP9863777.1 hypothetical protein [Synechococcus sp. Cruz-7E5]MCP9870928.1 hypothetical protein [Synechococcus sp. Cruz-7B9]